MVDQHHKYECKVLPLLLVVATTDACLETSRLAFRIVLDDLVRASSSESRKKSLKTVLELEGNRTKIDVVDLYRFAMKAAFLSSISPARAFSPRNRNSRPSHDFFS